MNIAPARVKERFGKEWNGIGEMGIVDFGERRWSRIRRRL